MKRFLSLFLALCMMLSLAPSAVLADEGELYVEQTAVEAAEAPQEEITASEPVAETVPAEEAAAPEAAPEAVEENPSGETQEEPAQQPEEQAAESGEPELTPDEAGHVHDYIISGFTDPTCTEDGAEIYTCACGASCSEPIPASGHEFENGVCLWCGAEDPDYASAQPAGEVPVNEEEITEETTEETAEGTSEETEVYFMFYPPEVLLDESFSFAVYQLPEQPASEEVVEEAAEPVAEETAEPRTEEVAEPAAEEPVAAEPVAEETAEAAAEPVAAEAAAEPAAAEPAEESTEPAEEPAAEKTSDGETAEEQSAEEETVILRATVPENGVPVYGTVDYENGIITYELADGGFYGYSCVFNNEVKTDTFTAAPGYSADFTFEYDVTDDEVTEAGAALLNPSDTPTDLRSAITKYWECKEAGIEYNYYEVNKSEELAVSTEYGSEVTIPAGMSVKILEDCTLTVASGVTLTVKGTLDVFGTLMVEGTLDVYGTLIVEEGGALIIPPSGSMNLLSGSVNMAGTLDVNGNLIIEEGTLTIASTGSVNIISGETVAATLNVYDTMDVYGTLLIDSGTLNIASTGSVNLRADSLRLRPAGSVNVEGALNVYSILFVEAGTLDIASTGSVNYLNGSSSEELTADTTIPYGGSLTVSYGCTLTVASGVTLMVEGTLDVYGTLIVEEGGALIIPPSGSMNLLSGSVNMAGTLDVNDNLIIEEGTLTIASTGSVNIISGETVAATLNVYDTMDVYGTLLIDSGTLNINNTGKINLFGIGKLEVSGSGKVNFADNAEAFCSPEATVDGSCKGNFCCQKIVGTIQQPVTLDADEINTFFTNYTGYKYSEIKIQQSCGVYFSSSVNSDEITLGNNQGVFVEKEATLTVAEGLQINLINGGWINMADPSEYLLAGALINNGVINIGEGSWMNFSKVDLVNSTGTFNLRDGQPFPVYTETELWYAIDHNFSYIQICSDLVLNEKKSADYGITVPAGTYIDMQASLTVNGSLVLAAPENDEQANARIKLAEKDVKLIVTKDMHLCAANMNLNGENTSVEAGELEFYNGGIFINGKGATLTVNGDMTANGEYFDLCINGESSKCLVEKTVEGCGGNFNIDINGYSSELTVNANLSTGYSGNINISGTGAKLSVGGTLYNLNWFGINNNCTVKVGGYNTVVDSEGDYKGNIGLFVDRTETAGGDGAYISGIDNKYIGRMCCVYESTLTQGLLDDFYEANKDFGYRYLEVQLKKDCKLTSEITVPGNLQLLIDGNWTDSYVPATLTISEGGRLIVPGFLGVSSGWDTDGEKGCSIKMDGGKLFLYQCSFDDVATLTLTENAKKEDVCIFEGEFGNTWRNIPDTVRNATSKTYELQLDGNNTDSSPWILPRGGNVYTFTPTITAEEASYCVSCGSSGSSIGVGIWSSDGEISHQDNGNTSEVVTLSAGQYLKIAVYAQDETTPVPVTVRSGDQILTISATPEGIVKGKTAKITVKGAQTGAKLSYKSSDEEVATVTAKGVVTGKKAGKATITVTASGAAGYADATGSVEITVYAVTTAVKIVDDGTGEPVGTAAVKVNLNSEDDEALKFTFRAATEPEGSRGTIAWSSNDKKNVYGTYTDNGDGTVDVSINRSASKYSTITLTATDTVSKKKATVKLETTRTATGLVLKLNGTEVTTETNIQIGSGNSLKFTAVPQGNPKDKAVLWTIAYGDSFATVSNGTLKALDVSEAQDIVLSAATKDGGASTDAFITILPKSTEVRLGVETSAGTEQISGAYTVYTNDTDQLTLSADVYPKKEDQTDAGYSVKWSGGNSAYATFTQTGNDYVVSNFKKTGTITLTAQSTDKGAKKATVKLTIAKRADDIEILDSKGKTITTDISVKGKGTYTFKDSVSTSKDKTIDKNVIWTLEGEDDAKYATLVKGKLTARSFATADNEPVYVTVRAALAANPDDVYDEFKVKLVPDLAAGIGLTVNGETVTDAKYTYTADLSEGGVSVAADWVGIEGGAITWSPVKGTAYYDKDSGTVKFNGKTGTVTVSASGTYTNAAGKKVTAKASFKLIIVNSTDSLSISGANEVIAGKSIKLTAKQTTKTTGVKASNSKLTWTVDPDPVYGVAFATISNGTLKANKVTAQKTVTVHCVSKDNETEAEPFEVTIYPAVTSVSILWPGYGSVVNKTVDFEDGMELLLYNYPNGDKGAMQKWTVKSSNTSLINPKKTINDGENLILNLKEGAKVKKATKVTITVTSADGSNKSAKFTVTVPPTN